MFKGQKLPEDLRARLRLEARGAGEACAARRLFRLV
jgi:hypothetical protein